MNFDFSDDQQAIKRTAKDFLAARFTADRVRELAEGGSYDDAAWKEICELGWPGIFVSEENGGQGLGIVELVILMEELGYALAPLPFLSTRVSGARPRGGRLRRAARALAARHRVRRAARRPRASRRAARRGSCPTPRAPS